MTITSTSTNSIAQNDTVKQYPFEGGGGLTVPGFTRAIGDNSSIPSRGYSVSGGMHIPGADSKSQKPWVGSGGDCRGAAGLLNLTTRKKSAFRYELALAWRWWYGV